MNDQEKNNIELPPKPWSPMKQAVFQGGIGTAIGAGASAGWQAALNWAHERKQTFSKNRIVDFAVSVGVMSALIGWYTAKGEAKEHDLKVDNVKSITPGKAGRLNGGPLKAV